MVDYKSSRFKNFKEYKIDLEHRFSDDTKIFNEDSTISYAKFRVLEIIENNRTR